MLVNTSMTNNPIDTADLMESIVTAVDGAMIVFEGVVRAECDAAGRELIALEYSGYGAMAEEQLRRICENAGAGREVSTIVAVHRLGRVGIGEASIAILVASPHRAAAFDVCRAIIEQTKVDLPVFKREIWSKGEATWVNPI